MPNFQIPQLRPNQVAIIVGALGIIVVVVAGYLFFRKPSTSVGEPVTLTAWGTEPTSLMKPMFDAYRGIRPNVTVTYTEVDPEDYQSRLIDALAAGEGPDVFTVPSTDIGTMRSKLSPAPATLTLASLQASFPKAVESDVVDGGAIYALPLSLDTLVLLYNRDLLDAAGITVPPTTWDAVVENVSRLAAVDDQSQIQRSAIALGGTTASIRNATDIVSLLMLQGGAQLANPAHSTVTLGEQGEAALRFYTQFANPGSGAYTWHDELGDSYQQFADGKLAMLIAYPSAIDEIKDRNAFIDVRIAPIPQSTGGTPRSYGTYPTLAVSKQSPNAGWGWDLVQTVTTNTDIAGTFAKSGGRAAALLSVISEQIEDPTTSVIGTQALQARSWFQWDGARVRNEVDRAIRDITSGSETTSRATQSLEQRLRALIRQ